MSSTQFLKDPELTTECNQERKTLHVLPASTEVTVNGLVIDFASTLSPQRHKVKDSWLAKLSEVVNELAMVANVALAADRERKEPSEGPGTILRIMAEKAHFKFFQLYQLMKQPSVAPW